MKLEELYSLINNRKKIMPENSYTARLFRGRRDRIIQKIGEESIEVLIAAKNKKKRQITSEISDLLFHLFILMSLDNITIQDIEKVLEGRKRLTKNK